MANGSPIAKTINFFANLVVALEVLVHVPALHMGWLLPYVVLLAVIGTGFYGCYVFDHENDFSPYKGLNPIMNMCDSVFNWSRVSSKEFVMIWLFGMFLAAIHAFQILY